MVLGSTFGAGDTIYVGTDAKGFTFSGTLKESVTKPVVEKDNNNDILKLKKATQDVNKAVEDAESDDEDDDIE